MNGSAVLPGDNQTLEAVDAWARAHVSTGTVMVLRRRGTIGIEFHLVEVDLLSTSTTFLFAPGCGSFETTGKQATRTIETPLLLVPLPDVVRAAIEGDVWAGGTAQRIRRKIFQRDVMLVQKLRDQAMKRGE